MKKNRIFFIYKKALLLGVFALLWAFYSCGGEQAPDCLQTAGDTVQQEVITEAFNKILVQEGIEMILREGIDYNVVIETGSNLLNEVEVTVKNNQLVLANTNRCNWFRSYAPVKVYVTTPTLTEIRTSTQFNIRSEGVLTYPQFSVLSEDYSGDYLNTGDVYLTIQNHAFLVTFNNLSNCYISGQTDVLTVGYYGGNGRFEGADLVAKQVHVFHRSSNDIIVYPTESLEGELHSTGNLIARTVPPVVAVTAYYKGQLIFEN